MPVTDAPPVNDEALALIDKGIESLKDRSLADANEMTDLLLDIRQLITTTEDP